MNGRADPVAGGLAARFREHLLASGTLSDGDRVVVALSGGLDSTVLAHLFRFTDGLPALSLAAAHVDHRMRKTSAGDADWVRGLARAWGIPLSITVLDPAPTSEAEARTMRYAFFESEQARTGARWVVTAHHADDQAETVLFRIARGTGLKGLRGIPEFRLPGIWRPLLPFGRGELEAYAESVGLRWRDDPTNRGEAFARNALRNEIIPSLERLVSPGARASVLRLAALARQDEEAWESLMPVLLASAGIEAHGESISFDRAAVLGYHPAVRARVLRSLAARLGRGLDAAGTRAAVEFTSSGRSGTGVTVTGALELRRDLDRFVFRSGSHPQAPARLLSVDAGSGRGEARMGGARFLVEWGTGGVEGEWVESFDIGALELPLTVRGWLPGDRIRLSYGSKKLKKVFLEAGLPRDLRDRIPVLVDARERVLWIPGLLRSTLAVPSGTNRQLNIGVRDANTD